MAALNIASHPQTHTEPFLAFDHVKLAGEQQKDPAIGKIVALKEENTDMTEDRRRTLDKPTRKLAREWSRLCVENGLLYRMTLYSMTQ